MTISTVPLQMRLALTKTEIRLLDHLVKLVTDKEIEIGLKRKLSPYYLTKIARLGGYVARSSDPAPGNMVM